MGEIPRLSPKEHPIVKDVDRFTRDDNGVETLRMWKLRARVYRAPDGPWIWLVDRASPRGLRELSRGRSRTRQHARWMARVVLLQELRELKDQHSRMYRSSARSA